MPGHQLTGESASKQTRGEIESSLTVFQRKMKKICFGSHIQTLL